MVLQYRDGNMWDVLVNDCGLVGILVLRFVIPVACMYGEPLCYEVGAQFYLFIVFLMSGGRG